ncbi:hypothetical protein L284_03345 [Novosphingobium lindaniclasticum LE124]|uniref:Uncharacterized protein n=1 Tax=Novosphingobium lindaniclasticum LE124 TaxID=1096930 RepID=T0I3D0_9SPHN|nr:hypothetical protein L284_03345 [Novosphingobium lindaniclasticum LE124]
MGDRAGILMSMGMEACVSLVFLGEVCGVRLSLDKLKPAHKRLRTAFFAIVMACTAT